MPPKKSKAKTSGRKRKSSERTEESNICSPFISAPINIDEFYTEGTNEPEAHVPQIKQEEKEDERRPSANVDFTQQGARASLTERTNVNEEEGERWCHDKIVPHIMSSYMEEEASKSEPKFNKFVTTYGKKLPESLDDSALKQIEMELELAKKEKSEKQKKPKRGKKVVKQEVVESEGPTTNSAEGATEDNIAEPEKKKRKRAVKPPMNAEEQILHSETLANDVYKHSANMSGMAASKTPSRPVDSSKEGILKIPKSSASASSSSDSTAATASSSGVKQENVKFSKSLLDCTERELSKLCINDMIAVLRASNMEKDVAEVSALDSYLCSIKLLEQSKVNILESNHLDALEESNEGIKDNVNMKYVKQLRENLYKRVSEIRRSTSKKTRNILKGLFLEVSKDGIGESDNVILKRHGLETTSQESASGSNNSGKSEAEASASAVASSSSGEESLKSSVKLSSVINTEQASKLKRDFTARTYDDDLDDNGEIDKLLREKAKATKSSNISGGGEEEGEDMTLHNAYESDTDHEEDDDDDSDCEYYHPDQLNPFKKEVFGAIDTVDHVISSLYNACHRKAYQDEKNNESTHYMPNVRYFGHEELRPYLSERDPTNPEETDCQRAGDGSPHSNMCLMFRNFGITGRSFDILKDRNENQRKLCLYCDRSMKHKAFTIAICTKLDIPRIEQDFSYIINQEGGYSEHAMLPTNQGDRIMPNPQFSNQKKFYIVSDDVRRSKMDPNKKLRGLIESSEVFFRRRAVKSHFQGSLEKSL